MMIIIKMHNIFSVHLYYKIKRKDKVVAVHTMKAYRGSRCITEIIIKLGIRYSWVAHSRPNRFTSEKEPLYLLYRRVGESQSWCVRLWKREMSRPFWNLNLAPFRPIPVTRSNTLSCLHLKCNVGIANNTLWSFGPIIPVVVSFLYTCVDHIVSCDELKLWDD